MSATFRVEAAVRASMIAKEALNLVGGATTPRLVEVTMAEVIAQATNLIEVARKEAKK